MHALRCDAKYEQIPFDLRFIAVLLCIGIQVNIGLLVLQTRENKWDTINNWNTDAAERSSEQALPAHEASHSGSAKAPTIFLFKCFKWQKSFLFSFSLPRLENGKQTIYKRFKRVEKFVWFIGEGIIQGPTGIYGKGSTKRRTTAVTIQARELRNKRGKYLPLDGR